MLTTFVLYNTFKGIIFHKKHLWLSISRDHFTFIELNWIEWGLKSYQHILDYLMTFPVLMKEKDLRIIQTD